MSATSAEEKRTQHAKDRARRRSGFAAMTYKPDRARRPLRAALKLFRREPGPGGGTRSACGAWGRGHQPAEQGRRRHGAQRGRSSRRAREGNRTRDARKARTPRERGCSRVQADRAHGDAWQDESGHGRGVGGFSEPTRTHVPAVAARLCVTFCFMLSHFAPVGIAAGTFKTRTCNYGSRIRLPQKQ